MLFNVCDARNDVLPCCVSRIDSELELQRYGMKKNTVTVDPIMPQDALQFLNVEVGSARFLENRYPTF